MQLEITENNILKIFKSNPDRKFKKEELQNLNWEDISRSQLSIKFIEAFKNYIHWGIISKSQILPEKFIEKHQGKVWWNYIVCYQKLSEKFIEKFENKITKHVLWLQVFQHQKLSEKFLEKYIDSQYNYIIATYQKLSLQFILKNLNKLDLNTIGIYQKLSNVIINKIINNRPDLVETLTFYHKLSNVTRNDVYNTLYWNKSDLRKMVKHSPYAILKDEKGEYIIAWKAVRKDRHSLFNFQFKYEKGKMYTSSCNTNIHEYNTFGFGAWTKNHAYEYGSLSERLFKIIQVKIYIKDLGVILPTDNYKIRARKITILT